MGVFLFAGRVCREPHGPDGPKQHFYWPLDPENILEPTMCMAPPRLTSHALSLLGSGVQDLHRDRGSLPKGLLQGIGSLPGDAKSRSPPAWRKDRHHTASHHSSQREGAVPFIVKGTCYLTGPGDPFKVTTAPTNSPCKPSRMGALPPAGRLCRSWAGPGEGCSLSDKTRGSLRPGLASVAGDRAVSVAGARATQCPHS